MGIFKALLSGYFVILRKHLNYRQHRIVGSSNTVNIVPIRLFQVLICFI
jgi:hypothetical protein